MGDYVLDVTSALSSAPAAKRHVGKLHMVYGPFSGLSYSVAVDTAQKISALPDVDRVLVTRVIYQHIGTWRREAPS